LFGGSALAADLRRPAYTPPAPPAPPPVYNWTGLYWGGNIGYSWGEAKRDFTVSGLGTASGSQDIDGVIGGFQAGYNYQFGTWVWGFETDIQASGQKGDSTLVVTPLTTITTDHKLEWFGTSRARLGVLWSPNILAYGTFGVAYGQVKDSATITVAGLGSATGTFKDVKAGWTAGRRPRERLRRWLERQARISHIDLGDTERTLTTPTTIVTDTRGTTDNIVRVGLN
jgi:outer membrane immunogenic protein